MTAASADGSPVPRLSVLLCDDNAMLLESLSDVVRAQPDLELVGTACDGEQACELARRHRPDVAVLDVRFPGGGHVVARGIARRSPATRIVAFSAYDDKASVEQMKSAGAAEYVLKGTSNRELLAALRRGAV
ncbi:response regulator transcription factor [Streptomyces sp. NPDC050703]|uniref:response regulator n=1 Tax=Streptomyces sp. NPDC050703 TaxID=3157218 RepID=UPI0034355B61